ncbi:transposase [Paenibacillus sp. N5-1-1-5]|uniref:Transposase n=1 Tax=Paenibacillus radicis (ex Xue et al. 2023) TaxID=2972489 RepID=A0ABT1YF16_9BACL|nr:transposase [Paenibacillus radicis (ex Xue et al. 2023)]MCR8631774.1 transposase [Paenibacillus radicis (ex Xue et al. 2023)]
MQLGYAGRYMRRPAITISRIEAYDGQCVTFRYTDKTDGEEQRETVTVEEFIPRVIRHIRDEQFKTIRHYGVYSRRTKSLSKKLVTEWQKEAMKWIVKAKKGGWTTGILRCRRSLGAKYVMERCTRSTTKGYMAMNTAWPIG